MKTKQYTGLGGSTCQQSWCSQKILVISQSKVWVKKSDTFVAFPMPSHQEENNLDNISEAQNYSSRALNEVLQVSVSLIVQEI